MVISHLLSMDYILIFQQGTSREIKILELLDIYCKATCMEVILWKYSLFFNHLDEEVKLQAIIPYEPLWSWSTSKVFEIQIKTKQL